MMNSSWISGLLAGLILCALFPIHGEDCARPGTDRRDCAVVVPAEV